MQYRECFQKINYKVECLQDYMFLPVVIISIKTNFPPKADRPLAEIQMIRTKKTIEKPSYIRTVGRRKQAIARVRLFKGKGEIEVNGKPINEYYPEAHAKAIFMLPFELTKTVGKYFATIKVRGGGKLGQMEAISHGLSRALSLAKPEEFKNLLKKQGLLTRDSRERERRKVGMGGKARRKRQSPKR